MKQFNAGVGGRDCWGNARERERMKARFNIRQRVNDTTSTPGGRFTVTDEVDNAVVSKCLLHIRRGDRSKFSTTFMDRHFAVVSAIHSTRQHILENSETLSETLLVATKLRNSAYSLALKGHMESLLTFTLTEYATWLGKSSIISSFLHGGVNPCVRGSSLFHFVANESNSHWQYQVENQERLRHMRDHQQQQLVEIGSKVLKRFFDSFPLRLSTYIVQRVVQMRNDLLEKSNSTLLTTSLGEDMEKIDFTRGVLKSHPRLRDTTTFHCPICSNTICIDFKLIFGGCQHVFCEFCFWKDMLLTIDTAKKQKAQDVVTCLVCGDRENCEGVLCHRKNREIKILQVNDSHLEPSERSELSLEKFRQLPVNQKELKAITSKKKKLSEVDHFASNWLEAIFPSLGSTQDVRLDKFSIHVERNAIIYVEGCLRAGVNINKRNEYGQSAIYVAAWRGYLELVKLLLDHGADASLPANGGSTISSIYSSTHRKNDVKALQLLDQYKKCFSKQPKDDARTDAAALLMKMSIKSNLECIKLIPRSSNHPGAGACFIDDAIPHNAIDIILDLFRSLPVDTNQKKKRNNAIPCSDRSYYCDAEGSLRRLIGNAILQAGLISIVRSAESVNDDCPSPPPLKTKPKIESSSSVLRVFPHMRFLNYFRPGGVLAPHIDLCRVNPFCPPSDKQNPRHRSTHTFILYLTDCQHGGETSLLERVTPDGSAPSLAKVSPRRGRLLIFPHITPHEGMEVIDVPKILLRGELQINNELSH